MLPLALQHIGAMMFAENFAAEICQVDQRASAPGFRQSKRAAVSLHSASICAVDGANKGTKLRSELRVHSLISRPLEHNTLHSSWPEPENRAHSQEHRSRTAPKFQRPQHPLRCDAVELHHYHGIPIIYATTCCGLFRDDAPARPMLLLSGNLHTRQALAAKYAHTYASPMGRLSYQPHFFQELFNQHL